MVAFMPLPLYPMYWFNIKLGRPRSLSWCSSLATAVANNLSIVKCKIEEKPPDSEFPGNVSNNWQLCLMIHTSDTETPHWWLCTEMKEMICVPRQQDLTSFSHSALHGAVSALDTPILVLQWYTPQDRCTLGLPGCSSVSEPKPQDLKHLE
jgi:hypothetical protein